MSGVGIGTSNRGMFDREDQLYVKNNALKNNVSAQEAENFAKNNPGAEAVIKNQDGTYSVYQMETSESGKTITNNDFTDDSIDLTRDVAKSMSGKKAYVVTNDNVIRMLEIKGIDLPSLDQKFGSANINLELMDKDGIETKSKGDLEGVLTGNLSISKESLEYSLAQASKTTGMGFKLDIDPVKNEYVITVSKGVDLGHITLKPGQGGINAKFDLSTVVNAAGYAISPIGMAIADPEAMISDFIRNKLSKDIGMKADVVNRNEIRLNPDFKNNKLISQIPVGDMNVNLESVKANNMNFKIDPRGDLQVDLGRTVVTASSDGSGALTKGHDTEGADKIKVSFSGEIGNDLSGNIKTNSSVEVKITDDEKGQLTERMKNLSGTNLSISGEAKVTDIKVDAKIDNGNFSVTNRTSGNVTAKNINVGMGSSNLKINSATGQVGVKEEGKKIIVDARNIDIKGGIDSPTTSVDFRKMEMNGDITYDKANPNKIKFEGDKNKGITLSLDIKDKKTKSTTTIEEFNVKGTDIEIDTAKKNVSLKPQDANSTITIDRVKMGDNVDLKKISFKGNLDIDPFSGKTVLESRALSFNGKAGDLQINNLRASGKMTYDPNNGVKLEGVNLQNASGKIGDFELSRVKAKGQMAFDNQGNLLLGTVSSLQVDTKSGVKASGNATVSYKNGVMDFTVKPNKPFNITYRPDKKEEALVSGQFEGNIKYDTNTSTISFNNADKPLKVKQGNIAGTEFKNFSLTGEANIGTDGQVTLNNSKGETVISGSVSGINLKELKADSPIIIDSKNKSVNVSGNVSIELPEQKLKVTTTGNISLSQKPDGKIILDSKDGVINGNLGGVEVENFKVQGKVLFDPKTGTVSLEGQNSDPYKISGKVSGQEIDLESSGAVSFNTENGNTKISSQGLSLKGNIGGFNIETQEGIKGNATISPEGKLLGVEGFNSELTIDGISLKNSGDFKTNETGYQIKLDGQITQDPGKLSLFLEKLSQNPIIPESSKAGILKAKEDIGKLNIENLKYENLTIDLDKDFSFNKLSVTAKELNISDPEKKLSLKSQGSITFSTDKMGKVTISAKDETINATIAGTEFKDFKINGSLNYEPKSGEISLGGILKQDFTVKGKIAGKNIELASNATIDLHKKGEDLEFSGNEMNLKGNIDGFKFESLSAATGNFLLKPDGHIDLSNLNFDFKVDDIVLSNKTGGLKSSDDGYTIKLGGNLETSQQSLIKFLEKVSVNSSTPDNAKHALKQTVRSLKDYMITGNIKEASYENLVIKLDKDLNVKKFDVDTHLRMNNSSVNLGLGANKSNKINVGTVDVVANIRSDDAAFSIKNGTVTFALTPDVKNSMANEVKNILSVYGLKDMDITVNDDGSIKINKATYDGLPIVDIDLGATAKFEGTKFNVVIDKANVKGFFGRVAQKFAEGIGGFDSRVVGVKEAIKRMEDMKVNYKDGDRSFSLDLKEILYSNIGEDFHLKNVEFKNGKFNLAFDVVVGDTKPFNPTNVVQGTKKVNDAIDKNQKEIKTEIKDFIVKQEPQDLSRILDKTTILRLKTYLKEDENVVQVMNKLANVQTVGHNGIHLKEFSSLSNDKLALNFSKTLDDNLIKNMNSETKANFIKALIKGSTNSEEEQTIKRFLLASDPKDIKTIVRLVGSQALKSELDSQSYNQIIALASI